MSLDLDKIRKSARRVEKFVKRNAKRPKDAIGDWHDWAELTDIAVDVLDHGKACELPKRLAATRETKYRHALSLTHALVQRLQPGVKPMLEAAAAITAD